MRKRKKPPRIIPVFRSGKEHAGHADGYVIHPDDREVRRLPPPKDKVSEEPANGG